MTPITVELLLDYGMVSAIWFSDKVKLANFPYKLQKSCELNLFPNKSLFIDIDSIPLNGSIKITIPINFYQVTILLFICLFLK
jgi:hypothetical protein